MCRRIALFFLALIAFGIAGAVWLATRRAPPLPTETGPTASPARVRAAEQRLRAALNPAPLTPAVLPPVPPIVPPSFREPVRPGPAASPAPVFPVAANDERTVRISQDDVNTMLASDLDVRRRLSKAGVSTVQITLSAPDRIDAVAEVDYQGHTADVSAAGRLSLTDAGELAFTPASMTVGVLPLPQRAADPLTRQVNVALHQVQQHPPLQVTSVRVENGQIVLTGPEKSL